jgi:hypothetical protein
MMRANGLTKSLWARYFAKAMSCPSVDGEGSREHNGGTFEGA